MSIQKRNQPIRSVTIGDELYNESERLRIAGDQADSWSGYVKLSLREKNARVKRILRQWKKETEIEIGIDNERGTL